MEIVDRETGEIIPSYISIDRKTNEITDIPASRVRIPERIGKTEDFRIGDANEEAPRTSDGISRKTGLEAMGQPLS